VSAALRHQSASPTLCATTRAPDGSEVTTGIPRDAASCGECGEIFTGAGVDTTRDVPAASSSDNVEGLVGTG